MSEKYRPLTNKELVEIIDEAIDNFEGQSNELESAIGALCFGRFVGWKPMLLMHDKKTLRKYETILKIDFRERLPAIGKQADKSLAWRAALKLGNFWKAVSGHTKGIRTNALENI